MGVSMITAADSVALRCGVEPVCLPRHRSQGRQAESIALRYLIHCHTGPEAFRKNLRFDFVRPVPMTRERGVVRTLTEWSVIAAQSRATLWRKTLQLFPPHHHERQFYLALLDR